MRPSHASLSKNSSFVQGFMKCFKTWRVLAENQDCSILSSNPRDLKKICMSYTQNATSDDSKLSIGYVRVRLQSLKYRRHTDFFLFSGIWGENWTILIFRQNPPVFTAFHKTLHKTWVFTQTSMAWPHPLLDHGRLDIWLRMIYWSYLSAKKVLGL